MRPWPRLALAFFENVDKIEQRGTRGAILMRLLTYYCRDREGLALYPHLAGPGLQVVIVYEVLPTMPERRKVLIWDGRTVIAVHQHRQCAMAGIVSHGVTRLRVDTGTEEVARLGDWWIVGTLHDVFVERIEADQGTSV